MALKVVSMAELRLELLLEAERTKETVSEICKRYGVTRQTFYEYRRRYLAEGIDGLETRSRRPYRSPNQIDYDLEVDICKMRKDHPRWGARRIRDQLLIAGVTTPPAISTIHQALRRNHLVADQPSKRRKFLKRFERDAPNDLWQIDATQVKLESRRKVWVVDVLDDHARFLLDAHACTKPTGKTVWRSFEQATERYGLPRQVLSDNAFYFTGRLMGFEVDFELKLEHLGVELINSAPYHPQTLGKLERFHKTLKEWVYDEGPPTDLKHLQELLDRFRYHYNEERPHQAIGGATPSGRYEEQPPAAPPQVTTYPQGTERNPEPREGDPTYPPHSILRRAQRYGSISFDQLHIYLGKRWAGALMRVVEVGELIHVFYGDQLVRVLLPDRSRRYQPGPSRRGRKVRPWD